MTEREAIEALRKLSRAWPAGLTLFADNGSLRVIRGRPDMSSREAFERGVVASVDIPCDGGDP